MVHLKEHISISCWRTAFRSEKEERGSNIHHLWVFPKSGQFPSPAEDIRRQTFTPLLHRYRKLLLKHFQKREIRSFPTKDRRWKLNSSNVFRGKRDGLNRRWRIQAFTSSAFFQEEDWSQTRLKCHNLQLTKESSISKWPFLLSLFFSPGDRGEGGERSLPLEKRYCDI